VKEEEILNGCTTLELVKYPVERTWTKTVQLTMKLLFSGHFISKNDHAEHTSISMPSQRLKSEITPQIVLITK